MPEISFYVIDSVCAYIRRHECYTNIELWKTLVILRNIRSNFIKVSDNNLIFKLKDTICIIGFIKTNDRHLPFKPTCSTWTHATALSYSDWLMQHFTLTANGFIRNQASEDIIFNFDDSDACCVNELLIKNRLL